MSYLTLPDYTRGKLIDECYLSKMTTSDLLNGYLIVNGTFRFPDSVKYPSIPCYVDKTTTVYPLNGKCLLTGPEYILAKQQGCEIKMKSAFYIPPKEDHRRVGVINIKKPLKPFQSIIEFVQTKRREFEKGHIMNLLYKEMGNSMYGNLVRGMANKKSFDTKTGKMFRISATELSNPILAS